MSKGIEGTGMSKIEEAKKAVMARYADAHIADSFGTICIIAEKCIIGLAEIHGDGSEDSAWLDAASKLTAAPLPEAEIGLGDCDFEFIPAIPVGEREGASSKSVACDCGAMVDESCFDALGYQSGITHESRKISVAALASKPSPAPEGIAERPSMAQFVSIEGGARAQYTQALNWHIDDLEKLLSAKDAELIQTKLELRDFQGQVPGLRGAWKFEYDRAEAAEAELTTLRASSARIEEVTLGKAWKIGGDFDLPRAPEGTNQNAYNAALREYQKRIAALLPTSPEKEQTGGAGACDAGQ